MINGSHGKGRYCSNNYRAHVIIVTWKMVLHHLVQKVFYYFLLDHLMFFFLMTRKKTRIGSLSVYAREQQCVFVVSYGKFCASKLGDVTTTTSTSQEEQEEGLLFLSIYYTREMTASGIHIRRKGSAGGTKKSIRILKLF